MILLWIIFGIIVIVSFSMDVGICGSRENKIPSIRQACILSLFWVLLAFSFNFLLYLALGAEVAIEFFASYLLEKGLSVDNVFVFYVIFETFKVPERFQRRILQWGTSR